MRILVIAVATLTCLLLLPSDAWAFGPATHVFLGEQILNNLSYLPPVIADLLRAYPQSFLYGSMAADISLAKKYVPLGRHCHYWHVGEEIFEEADNDRLRAVALGYLSHLAADTIAHNFFVPRQLMLTSSTKALGHSIGSTGWTRTSARGSLWRAPSSWTTTQRGGRALRQRAQRDDLLFETNRRIFRGMIRSRTATGGRRPSTASSSTRAGT